jgi:pimeloyl-ACP methyl ester carboxylesterase
MAIVHRVVGAGPAVLLVHAGVADARMWERQVEDLRRDHRVIAPDLRGFGETPLEVAEKYSDAGDLLELLDELRLENVTAVGASYGANVVLQAASRAPERFSRLVLISPPVFTVEKTPDLKAFGAAEDQLLEAGDVDGATDLNVRTWLGPEADDEARELLRVMQRRAFEVQLAAGDDIENEDYELRPELLTMPVRLFSGDHDLRFFRDSAAYLVDVLPSVEHVKLPWAGHLPTLERPADGVDLVRAALTSEA